MEKVHMLYALVVVLVGLVGVLYYKLKKLKEKNSSDRNDYYKELQIRNSRKEILESKIKDYQDYIENLTTELDSYESSKAQVKEAPVEEAVKNTPRKSGKRPRN